MVDVVDKATRSRMMSGIRGRDTKPEMQVRRFLHAAGFRYRISPKHVYGKPDIVLKKYNTVIFVHGCFWHRHPRCKFASTPVNNKSFWNAKFKSNITRDRLVSRRLRREGWNVIVIWSCQIDNKRLDSLSQKICNCGTDRKIC